MTQSDKEIIKKVIDGYSSKDNARYVVNWFSSTIEGQQALSDLIDKDAYLMEESLLENKKISSVQSAKILEKIESEIRKKKIIKLTWRIAAVFFPFIFLLGLGIYVDKHFDVREKTTYSEIYVPKGKQMHLLFQDGSKAILNSDSKIKYPNKFGLKKREVFLEGEAYFTVTHDKHRPFKVITEKSDITVLGTSFNVYAYKDYGSIDVTLDEGSILFNTPHNQHRLIPGQQLIFNKESEEYAVRNLSNSRNQSLWTQNSLFFNDTPLTEVIQILERKFNVEFSVKDRHALDYSYTLTTADTGIENILPELEKITPVKFKLYNGVYEVTTD